jgi:hypothetical protein
MTFFRIFGIVLIFWNKKRNFGSVATISESAVTVVTGVFPLISPYVMEWWVEWQSGMSLTNLSVSVETEHQQDVESMAVQSGLW